MSRQVAVDGVQASAVAGAAERIAAVITRLEGRATLRGAQVMAGGGLPGDDHHWERGAPAR